MIDRLNAELAELRESSTKKVLAVKRTEIFRKYLDASLERILTKHRTGGSGQEVVDALTRRIDDLVQSLYKEAVLDLGSTSSTTGYAVLAQGGYGRAALNPMSDIDLLFLFEKVEKGDPITRTILHTLWDLRFEIGYSTRSISDCIAAAQDDTDSLTAMLEARFLAGDSLLFSQLDESLARRFFGRRANSFIASKAQERRMRHAKAGFSVQLLEPDIKESPGGLRDTHAVGWFLKARRGVNAPDGLLTERLLSRRNHKAYVTATSFLLRARNELHFSTQKPIDILEHDLQPNLALNLGYKDNDQELGVEQFMRDYYLHARTIRHMSDLICEKLSGEPSVANRAVGLIVRRSLDDGTILSRSHISLPKKRKNFFSDDPHRLLSIFLGAQRFGVQINEAAKQAVKDNLHLIDESLRNSPRAARIFLDILRAPAGVAYTLRDMHELEVLGSYAPEFGSLTCLVQYNRYHIYTADEHTLVALDNLEHLPSDAENRLDLLPLKQAFNEIPRKDLLYLSLLLHDVGKSARDDDHSTTGAEMSVDFLRRLGLNSGQIDTVTFLVQQHLTMSHISQRRDLSDDAMLTDFAGQFKHPNVLRMLYLLTYADLSAVTPTAWTAWKAQLLTDLFMGSFRILTRGSQAESGQSNRKAIQRLVAELSDRFPRRKLEEHLKNLPPRYPGMNSPEEAERHLRLIDSMGKSPVSLKVDSIGLVSEITLCTHDKPYRLSEICGVFATNDLNIFGAHAYTRNDGIVINIFQVTNADGSQDIEVDSQNHILEQLTDVISGKIPVQTLFEQHQERWSRRRSPAMPIPTEIQFVNEVSERYTVIDVFAQDGVGLLYKITRTLSDLGLDIYTARITTQADKAIDSFYVRSKSGRKIEHEETLENIRNELVAQIQ